MTTMTTQGGSGQSSNPHPADYYAEHAARQIGEMIVIDPNSSSDAAREARKAKPRFVLAVQEELEPYFEDVQEAERDHLDEHGNVVDEEHHVKAARFDPTRHHTTLFENAVDKVVELAKGTPFEAGYATDQERANVCAIIATHMATAQYVEHSIHKDRGGETWREAV